MKIKNLLLLGLLTVFGMNAFAADYKSSGIIYDIAGDGKTASVKAISSGMTDANAATITIPATFVDGDGNTVKVTAFTSGWENNEKNVTALVTTLKVDVTNFAAAVNSGDYGNLTKLGKLVLSGAFTPAGKAADYTVGALAGTETDLDLSGLTGKDKVIISAIATPKLANVTMPAQATVISANAFLNATALTGIDLTNVTEIGANAFDGCSNEKFKSLTIGANIAKDKIGANAFDNMASLTSITIENNNLASIGAWFAGDSKVENLTITSTSVTAIADNAFSVCPIKNLTISAEKLATIGAGVFAAYVPTKIDLGDLSALVNVDATSFPSTTAYTSVKLGGTKIDDTNFANALAWTAGSAASLKTYYLPGKITKVPDNAFKGFAKLGEITLTKNITLIGVDAFSGTGLATVKITGKVETIEKRAFADCAALASVDFSEAAELTTINANAFNNDPKLLAIDLSGAAKLETVSSTSFPQNYYTSLKLAGTALDDADMWNVYNWLQAAADADGKSCKTTLKEVTLPAGITMIPGSFFDGYAGLTSVSIPKAVTYIGGSAFRNSGLTAIKIRENVTTIDDAAFQGCEALAVANFSEATALQWIGDFAFNGTAITEVAIPAAAEVNYIGMCAFLDCTKLKSFSAKGWTGGINDGTFEGCTKLTGFVVPKGITSIGAEAFKGAKALATVTFKYEEADAALSAPASIGAGAFEDCAALTALDLTATKIQDLSNANIFKGCTSLATITFPETLTDLSANNLFSDCPIESLEAPNVTTSGILFGTYWDKTAGVYVVRDAKNANTTLKSVTIGGDVPGDCFAYCTALESVTYFENAYGATVDDYAFEHCTGLKTFTYEPETTIDWQVVENDAFHGCIPFVQFVSNNNYIDFVVAAGMKAPVNATFGDAEVTTVKTVQDKANPNQFIQKYWNDSFWAWRSIDAAEAKVYSIYVDGETAYFQACRVREGTYDIPPYGHVIVKTDAEKEVTINLYNKSVAPQTSIGFDDVYASEEGDDLADVQDGVGLTPGFYLYRLTNTDDQGFGFTYFSGTTIKPNQFFVACSKKPEGAGRVNIVWLDEDGNVEGDATAIQKVESNVNDGAIYNLQGVRVENVKKGGIYIQNGKKFVK